MPLQVNQNSFVPSSAASPDGTFTFPLNFVSIGGTVSTAKLSDYPNNATPLQASTGNLANTIGTATLVSAVGRTAFITGFEVTGSGATAGLPVIVTVAGLLGGTASFIYTFALGVLVGNNPLIVQFPSALPASGTNINIVVSCPASGAGGTNNAVTAHGYMI